jgi:hypothetical protein
MFIPSFTARVKEGGTLACIGIQRGEVGAFVAVAIEAGERKIIAHC